MDTNDQPTTVIEQQPDALPSPDSAGAPESVSTGKRWPLIVLAIISVVVLIAGAWAFQQRSDAKDEALDAKNELRAAKTNASSASDTLNAQIKTLSAKNSSLQKRIDKLEKDAASSKASAESNDSTGMAGAFSAGDEDILVGLVHKQILAGASDSYDECAKISLVGSDSTGDWAIMRAEFPLSSCKPDSADPAEFLFNRGSNGTWKSVPVTVKQEADPTIDSLVICGADLSADEGTTAAVVDICA